MKSRFCGASHKRSLLLVAPADAHFQPFHGKITRSRDRHSNLIRGLQRLRGEIYREDGAVGDSALTPDGRHTSPTDNVSWHLLTVDNHGEVLGCIRFRQHSTTAQFDDLGLKESSQANCSIWGRKLKASVTADLQTARDLGFKYIEVGGWALSRQIRATTEALQSVLSIFAWSQVMGGALGVSTATERNGSASILKRLGGNPMQFDGCALPPYYDGHYNCGMEILRFDSRLPNPRYAEAIQELRRKISRIEIVQDASEQTGYQSNVPFFVPNLRHFEWGGTPSSAY